MSWLLLLGWICWWVVAALAVWFVVTFVREEESRAATVTAALAAPGLGLGAALLAIDYPGRDRVILVSLGLATLALFVVALRREASVALEIVGPQTRVDERDALFHRFYRLQAGTPEFEAYYTKHPDKRATDERTRKLPPLAGPRSRSYHPLTTPFQVACFEQIAEMARDIEWQPTPLEDGPVPVDPDDVTRRIKGFARYLGAKSVGCTRLDPAHVYSHGARGPGTWGEPVALDHSHAVALTVEMSHDMMRQAPDTPTTTETALQYVESGKIAMLIARYINLLGYEARAHVDGNYRVMCVPIAADAGLGELGRLGLLMTPELGPRVRLAVVTTTLPLVEDQPITFGVQDFCSFCKKCAEICPSRSIDRGKKAVHAGVEKWQTVQDTCYDYWRRVGSDCSLCVRVCPYSHPANAAHDLVRWFIRRNHLARRLALWADDLAYGRRPSGNYSWPDWHANDDSRIG